MRCYLEDKHLGNFSLTRLAFILEESVFTASFEKF